MAVFRVEPSQEGRRLDRVVRFYLPGMPQGLVQKALRTGQILLNGQKAEASARVSTGDELTARVDDAFLTPEKKPDRFLSAFRPHLTVVYEDQNVLFCDKTVGLICHADEREKVNTLINHVRAYLYQKGESPDVNLCNRIDRFTGGIVLCAKNGEALHDLDTRIRQGKVRKYYLCAVQGRPPKDEGIFDNWLYQRSGERKMRVSRRPVPEGRRAVTAWRVLHSARGLSLVECELFSGRTHQIRAQFADAGYPLAGDSQYGHTDAGGRAAQALYAWRVAFDPMEGPLDYLSGRSFRVRDVPFIHDYFPGLALSPAPTTPHKGDRT